MLDLTFNQDGTFKIVQFTDLHWENGGEDDLKTKYLMENILEKENPDLVVLTGDLIYSPNCDTPADSLCDVLEPINRKGVQWAAVYGNHDTEVGVTKKELLDVQQQSPLCLTKEGNVSGVGNYQLHIYGANEDQIKWSLFFLDSGMMNTNEQIGGYDYIKRDQIDWYVKQSQATKKQHGACPELMFFHIPIPEFQEVWKIGNCYGDKHETVCSPKVNSGLFSAMQELHTVKGVFVGHDHINDYHGNLYGIQLCYGRATGYNTYGKEGFPRGARVIHLHEGSDEFETYIRLDDHSVIRYEDEHMPDRT